MYNEDLPRIWTPEEIAQYLKVDEQAVLQEIEEGNLQGFMVGKQWRCSEQELHLYISGSKNKAQLYQIQPTIPSQPETNSGFTQIGPFDYRWPTSVEHYSQGYETTRYVNGQNYTFKIGFTERESAGRLRPRVVVWIGDRALVEFAGGNNYEKDGLLASVIKLPNGTQLQPNKKIPIEYSSFNIRRYDSIVQGPYASRNMAIVVHKDDLESMLSHAIVRAKWKGLA
jgi:excisionase family DNA binding protein